MPLEEVNWTPKSDMIPTQKLTSLVLNHESADDELTCDYAVMADEDDDEGLLTGIKWSDLYSFHTRQVAH